MFVTSSICVSAIRRWAGDRGGAPTEAGREPPLSVVQREPRHAHAHLPRAQRRRAGVPVEEDGRR